MNYTSKKIPRTTFYDGLIKNNKQLQIELAQKGFKDAGNYIELVLAIDKLIINQYGDDPWEGPLPKDTALIKTMYASIEQNMNKCKDVFVKERYLYTLLKTSASIGDHVQTIRHFEKYNHSIHPKTFISDWSWSKYAGALYHSGDHARSFYEFSKIFAQSETMRSEAGHSVWVYNIPYSEKALYYCKNDAEKVDVYALAAILPQGDGLGMMKKIYEKKPEHEMLQLIATREINKNEELLYNVKLAEDEYNPSLNTLNKTHIPELLTFFTGIIHDNKIGNTDFWKLAAAYMYFLTEDSENGKKYVQQVKEDPSNEYIVKQKKLLGILLDLQSTPLYDQTTFSKIYSDIGSIKKMDGARDMSALKLVSKKLEDYFLAKANNVTGKKSTSFFSGCGKKQDGDNALQTDDSTRVFFAQCLSNISGFYDDEDGSAYLVGGHERQLYLDTLTTRKLGNIVGFVEREDKNPLDTMLTGLANISNDEIYLAYGRRLMLDHRFEDALEIYKKITPVFMKNIVDQVDFRKGPELYLPSWKYETIDDYVAYLTDIVRYKKATVTNPEDAEIWFKLGEAMINISYHGKAWILSKSMWSSAEMDYYWWGHDSQKALPNEADVPDYYANMSAIICLENASRYCKDKNLGAKISYLGAMAERNKFWSQYYKNQPEDYEKQEKYHQDQMLTFEKQYRNFFQLLSEKFNGDDYEKMIIKECEGYKDFLH